MIIIHEEPDEFLQAFWDLNAKYPEYVTCVSFDHVSLPTHLMDEVKKLFKKRFAGAVESAMSSLNEEIEVCQEKGQDPSSLFKKRKALREMKGKEFPDCKTIEKLHTFIPEELKPHWRKS